MKKVVSSVLSFLLLLVLFAGCREDDGGDDQSVSFDRAAMLANYSNNLILPAISDLQSSTSELETAVNELANNPNEANLQTAQEKWITAATDFQFCASLNFGPGETLYGSFSENAATFPTDTIKIANYIASGDTSQNNFDRDARGFIGLDFFLFRTNAVNRLANQTEAAYMRSAMRNLSTLVNDFKTDWDAYATDFVANNGTGSSSSISLMYNTWLISFEVIKNYKVGLPAGLRVGQTQAEPTQVEAYYSGQSLALMEAHLQLIENFYFGNSLNGTEGLGFDDYLKASVGGESVYQQTVTQWNAVMDAFNSLPQNKTWSEIVVENPDLADDLYTALSQQTRFFKSELSSRIGITITYDSGDGD